MYNTPEQFIPPNVKQRVSQDFAFLASGGTKTGNLSSTEIALLSATAFVVMLGALPPTRRYAPWAGGLILLAWAHKFYVKYLE